MVLCGVLVALAAIFSDVEAMILSIFIMQVLKFTGFFSIIGVSMAGGVFHNVGQVTMAVLVMETVGLYSYLAPLILVGMATGTFIGIVSAKALVHLTNLRV